MAKANVILLNSILWNLREVTKLAEKIKSHSGDVDCVSWRYPLTLCSDLEVFKLLQNNRNLDSYTYILELTYDRLLYVFNLLIKYLEMADGPAKKFRPGKNVQRPKTLSLASVLHMIWERIKAQAETVKNTPDWEPVGVDDGEGKDEVSIRVSKSSTCTQSEVCSISVCSCCEMVQQFVTQLVLEMEKILDRHQFSSAISKERQFVRENLVEMTNWSAMSKWLTAIIKDFTAIAEMAEEEKSSSRKLKHRLESGEQEMKSKIGEHEKERRKLEERIQEQEARVEEMQKKITEIIKEKCKLMEEVKSKSSDIAGIKSDFNTKMEELKKSYESKLAKRSERRLKKEKQKESEWKLRLEGECSKRLELECQKEELVKEIEKLKLDLKKLNEVLEEEKSVNMTRCLGLEAEVENLKLENLNLQSVIKEKQKTIEEYSVRIMEAFPELNGDSKSKYKASGNPLIDMENQIEANKLRMDVLKAENEKLTKTLVKFRAIKA